MPRLLEFVITSSGATVRVGDSWFALDRGELTSLKMVRVIGLLTSEPKTETRP